MQMFAKRLLCNQNEKLNKIKKELSCRKIKLIEKKNENCIQLRYKYQKPILWN